MAWRSQSILKYVFVGIVTVPLCFGVSMASASMAQLGIYITFVSKAYCDKCVDGFSSQTEEGYNIWKRGTEVGDDPIPATSGLGKTIATIQRQSCEESAKIIAEDRTPCDSLLEKFMTISSGPDSKYISSEATWKTYISALRGGNKEGVLACFESSARTKYRQYFDSISNDAMASMAERMELIGLSEKIDTYQEGMVRNGEKSGIVLFVNVHGEWKISQL